MHFLWLFIVLFPLHAFLAAFDFVLFLHVFLAAVALQGFTLLYFRRIKIHPYPLIQGHYGLFAKYWVRLANPFCFLFSSFIHYIGLGLLTHLLHFLFF